MIVKTKDKNRFSRQDAKTLRINKNIKSINHKGHSEKD